MAIFLNILQLVALSVREKKKKRKKVAVQFLNVNDASVWQTHY